MAETFHTWRFVGADSWSEHGSTLVFIETVNNDGSEVNLIMPKHIARNMVSEILGIVNEPEPEEMHETSGGSDDE